MALASSQGLAVARPPPPTDEDVQLLAQTGQKVLDHVDDTLAAVSDKLHQLLVEANLDLSDADIQSLLETTTTNSYINHSQVGVDREPPQSPTKESSDHVHAPNSKQAPSSPQLLPTVDEDRTTTASTSVISAEIDSTCLPCATSPAMSSCRNKQPPEVIWEESATVNTTHSLPVDGDGATMGEEERAAISDPSADAISLIHSDDNNSERMNITNEIECDHDKDMDGGDGDGDDDDEDDDDDDDDEVSIATTLTVATTATRRELKNRVGDIEGNMEAFVRQMQTLQQRMQIAEQTEQAKQVSLQHQREAVLQTSQQVIVELQEKVQHNELQVQEWQAKAEQVRSARARIARAQQEKAALEAKTQALQEKLNALRGVLMGEDPVMTRSTMGIGQSSQTTSTNKATASKEDNNSQKAWLAVFMAVIVVAIVVGEYSVQQPPLSTKAPSHFSVQETSSGVFEMPNESTRLPQEDGVVCDDGDGGDDDVNEAIVVDWNDDYNIKEEIPSAYDLTANMAETILEEQEDLLFVYETEDSAVDEKERATTSRLLPSLPLKVKEIMAHLLRKSKDAIPNLAQRVIQNHRIQPIATTTTYRGPKVKQIAVHLWSGFKDNTTVVWGKIKGIGDDIPNLVSLQ